MNYFSEIITHPLTGFWFLKRVEETPYFFYIEDCVGDMHLLCKVHSTDFVYQCHKVTDLMELEWYALFKNPENLHQYIGNKKDDNNK